MEAVLDQSEQGDFERQTRLEEVRAKDERNEGEKIKSALRKLLHFRRSIPHIDFAEGFLMLFITGAADLVDYLVVGSIPVVGDIIDVGIWLAIAIWVWLRAIRKPPAVLFSGIIELIPFGDLIPTFIAMVLVIIIYNNALRRFGEKRLKKMIAKTRNKENS